MNVDPLSEAARELSDRFGVQAEAVAFAPGRVNLIGEHVDYVGGVVLPAPIARGTRVALAMRGDPTVRVGSRSVAESFRGAIDTDPRTAGFAGYPLAAMAALRERGLTPGGFDLAIVGDLPIGAGLSSSASLLVATLRAFDAALGLALAPGEIAELAFVAEHRFIGVACGRMDPIVCAVGKPDHALRIDCRDGSTRDLALPRADVAFVVVDSGIRRELAHSAYNQRVAECARALASLRGARPDLTSLRDATILDLDAATARLDRVAWRRANHVVREIARVDEFVTALAESRFAEAGSLLDASHASLRDDYEVSTPELDVLQRRLRESPGCLGARLTGAGFGGCLVAMVERPFAEDFARAHGGFTAL